MRFGRTRWMREMFGEPQTRGFLWGAGAALAAYFLWPAVREAVRPCAKGVIRGAMVAGDRFRYALATAREGVEDVIAEAQFERLRGAAAPEAADGAPGEVPDLAVPEAAAPPHPKKNH